MGYPASEGRVAPVGRVGLQIIRKGSWIPEEAQRWNPKTDLGRYIRDVVLAKLPGDAALELFRLVSRSLIGETILMGKRLRGGKVVEDYGVLSRKVVTDTGVGYIVDAFQNLVELENMKFHGIGTGSTAEAAANTALVTELTTQYNPDNTRATGSTTEAAANIYQTVGTNTLDAAANITEHGIFSSATSGAGVLLDRSLFGVLTLSSGDSLQTDYRITLSSGG